MDAQTTFFKRGMIILWSGSADSIPDGWHLCDGTNGTPDLRDRFVVCAGNNYAVGNKGGSAQHRHTFTTDGHEHYAMNTLSPQPGDGIPYWDGTAPTDTATDSGTTEMAPNLPPYYALCYIMKL